MRKGLILLILGLLICNTPVSTLFTGITAQYTFPDLSLGDSDLIWSYRYEAANESSAAYSVIPTEDGGCLLVGEIRNGGSDVLIIRLNEACEIEWINIPTDYGLQTAQDVIECDSGGYAIIGYNQPNFMGGSTSYWTFDAYLIRIANNGTILWTQNYGTPDYSEEAYSLIECEDGGFAFAGYSTNNQRLDTDFWLVRTTSDGQPLWNRTYGGLGDQVSYSLVETHNGGFVLVGSTVDENYMNLDGWIVCTDSSGAILWNQTYGWSQEDECQEVIRRGQHGYIVAGTTHKLLHGGYDAFVLSLELDGSFSWNTTFGNAKEDMVNSITACQGGGYAITGYTIEDTQFGDKTHLWLVRLDLDGNLEWTKRYGGMGHEIGWAIVQASNHDFIIVGTTESHPGQGFGTNALLIRVPDIEPLQDIFGYRGPPRYELIALGVISGLFILAGMSLLYLRSKRGFSSLGSIPKKYIRKTFYISRPLHELIVMLSGIVRCRHCGSIVRRNQMTCPSCSAHLHRCLFCDDVITDKALAIFCPNCRNLAHADEMLAWMEIRNKCPICGFRLKS